MDKPCLIISLDTELLWGPAERILFDFIKRKGKEVRKAIPTLLNLFEKYEIPVTWAIVGHLFLESCEKETCITWKNMNKYNYRKKWYNDPYSNIDQNPLFYGKDIVEEILSNPLNHEIGYHSFSHPRFTEIPREMAENEIKEAKKIEKEWGIKLKVFVFPGDEIAHVDILKENGFKIYRGKSAGIYDPSKNIFIRKFTGGITKIIATPVEPIWADGIWEIQSSMLFSDPQIPQSLLLRAKLGLEKTIKKNKVFNIFLHPWNLLLYRRLESDLEKFFKYVFKKRDKGELQVLTMGKFAELLDEIRY